MSPIATMEGARRRTVATAPPMFAADSYRSQFGWRVDQLSHRLTLNLDADMVAVQIPTSSNQAARVLELLRQRDYRGPVLQHETDEHWTFFADANGIVLDRTQHPRNVRILTCPAVVQLPSGSNCGARWIVPPSIQHRWLPTLAAVIGTAYEVCGRPPTPALT